LAAADYNVYLLPSGGQWSKMTNPMFQNAPTDFTPASGSPLVNAGDGACSPSCDLCGRVRDSRPDTGAHDR
jgi:hypothetical protein